jgi:hypothetical protein
MKRENVKQMNTENIKKLEEHIFIHVLWIMFCISLLFKHVRRSKQFHSFNK